MNNVRLAFCGQQPDDSRSERSMLRSNHHFSRGPPNCPLRPSFSQDHYIVNSESDSCNARIGHKEIQIKSLDFGWHIIVRDFGANLIEMSCMSSVVMPYRHVLFSLCTHFED